MILFILLSYFAFSQAPADISTSLDNRSSLSLKRFPHRLSYKKRSKIIYFSFSSNTLIKSFTFISISSKRKISSYSPTHTHFSCTVNSFSTSLIYNHVPLQLHMQENSLSPHQTFHTHAKDRLTHIDNTLHNLDKSLTSLFDLRSFPHTKQLPL